MVEKERQKFDIRIDKDGFWYYQKSKINRFSLVKLFSSILHYKEDGQYWLITSKEKGIIEVEDAPFVINKVEFKGSGKSLSCWVTTNIEDRYLIGEKNNLNVIFESNGIPRPYVYLDRGLKALVLRNIFYELVENSILNKDGWYGIWSDGIFFRLGRE